VPAITDDAKVEWLASAFWCPRLKGESLMQPTQSAFAIAFCAMGAIVLAVAHYQVKHHQIGKVQLISPRAKHVIGLLGIIIGVLIFAAQLMLRR
jgi:hypothetical protein